MDAPSMFMKVAGSTGESMNQAYPDWTDVYSIEWGLRSTRRHGSQGAAQCSADDVRVVALYDPAAPGLLQKAARGTNIPKVEFAYIKMGDEQIEYMRYTIEDVYVTAATVGKDDREVGLPTVTYAFNYAKCKLDYKAQTERGSAGGGSTATWDMKQNKP